MGKTKTITAISKRVKLTGGKKRRLMLRSPGQDHFNARDTGKNTRNKRRGFEISGVYHRTIRRALNKQ